MKTNVDKWQLPDLNNWKDGTLTMKFNGTVEEMRSTLERYKSLTVLFNKNSKEIYKFEGVLKAKEVPCSLKITIKHEKH